MKTHKENILEHLQKFLDDNVSDYTNFNSDYWFKKYKKQYYRKMNFDYLELYWIVDYLLEIDEKNKISHRYIALNKLMEYLASI